MSVIPVGFSQVNLIAEGASFDGHMEVTFGIENTLGADPGLIAATIEGILTTENWGYLLNGQNVWTGVLVKNGPNETGPSAELAISINGLGAGDPAPGNVAVLIQKQTALGGRAGRGRFFIGGVSEQHINGRSLNSAEVSAWQTRADDFLNALDVGSIPMVLLHQGVGTPTPVTGLEVQTTLATQRRRQRR